MTSTSTSRGRGRYGAILAVMSALSVILLAAPASASTSTPQQEALQTGCGWNTGCGWEDPDFRGDRWFARGVNSCHDRKCEIDGWNGDNEISSVANYTNCTLRLYDWDQWDGPIYELPPNSTRRSLGTFNDRAESFAFICPS